VRKVCFDKSKAFEYINSNNTSDGEDLKSDLSVAECYQLIILTNIMSVHGTVFLNN
jgi:hypothetical protein